MKIANQIFHYTCCFTPKHVTSLRNLSPRHCACGQHSSFRRNVAAVASRRQHCVRFNRPENWTSNLMLQRQTRYCSKSTKQFMSYHRFKFATWGHCWEIKILIIYIKRLTLNVSGKKVNSDGFKGEKLKNALSFLIKTEKCVQNLDS